MSGWSSRLWRDRGGVSAVEFALFLPIFLVMLVSMTEVGRILFQAAAVEKGIRAGAMYVARTGTPLSAADEAVAANIAKTGDPDGSGPYLVAGWSDPAAGLSITSRTFPVGDSMTIVYRLSASVPYRPLLPGLMSAVGLGDYRIEFAHEQAYIGQ